MRLLLEQQQQGKDEETQADVPHPNNPNNPGNNSKFLHVEFPNHKLLKGFVIALDEMKDELRGAVGGGNVQLELDGRNVFEVLR